MADRLAVAVLGAGGTMGSGMSRNIARAGLELIAWNRSREKAEPVGRRTMWVGEAGAGSRLKLIANAWLVSVVEGVAETIALARGLELDPELFLQAIEDGPLDAPYARIKAQAMIDRDFEPTFALKHATKDAKLAADAAARRELDLPVLAAIARRMDEAVPEHGDEDLSATYLSSAP
jgi:3-hydroxyisobutyrate dehydrogenase